MSDYQVGINRAYNHWSIGWLPVLNETDMTAQSIPKTTKQWNVAGHDGVESLEFTEQPVPQLGDNQVLVRSKFLPTRTESSRSSFRLTTNLSPWRFAERKSTCSIRAFTDCRLISSPVPRHRHLAREIPMGHYAKRRPGLRRSRSRPSRAIPTRRQGHHDAQPTAHRRIADEAGITLRARRLG